MIGLMQIRDARAHLVAMLSQGGVTPGAITSTDLRTVVDVYRRFARIRTDDAAPAAEDGDGVLAQFGMYSFRGSNEFSVELTRQFIESGDGARLWQLNCTIYYAPSTANGAMASGALWSFGMTLDEFFDHAAALAGWAWALAGSEEPRELVVAFSEV
jgi:hypothetical protein